MEGRIGFCAIPQDSQGKLRPVLILREFPVYGDVLICAITSQLQHQSSINILIDAKHPDFNSSRLRKDSVIRLDTLVTISRRSISHFGGSLSAATHYQLLNTLSRYLVQNTI